MTLTLQKLLPRHYAIIDLFLDGNLSISQIASHPSVQLTTAAIRNIRNSPTFQHELSLRRSQRNALHDELDVRDDISKQNLTAQIIEENTEQAAEKIVELLSSHDDSIQLRSAAELLDRGGFPKLSKMENSVKAAVVVLSKEDLHRIERTINLDNEPEQVIDVIDKGSESPLST